MPARSSASSIRWPVKRSSSTRMARIVSATFVCAHGSFIEEFSIPRKTVVSERTDRTISAAPISWMQWSAVKTAS